MGFVQLHKVLEEHYLPQEGMIRKIRVGVEGVE
jgi:hypothetical protein